MISRIALTLLLTSAACATPMAAPQPDLESPLQAQVHNLINGCSQLHEKALSGESPIDCQILGARRIHLSFQSRETHKLYQTEVGRLVRAWCESVQALTRSPEVYYSWDYYQERESGSSLCPASRKVGGNRNNHETM